MGFPKHHGAESTQAGPGRPFSFPTPTQPHGPPGRPVALARPFSECALVLPLCGPSAPTWLPTGAFLFFRGQQVGLAAPQLCWGLVPSWRLCTRRHLSNYRCPEKVLLLHWACSDRWSVGQAKESDLWGQGHRKGIGLKEALHLPPPGLAPEVSWA